MKVLSHLRFVITIVSVATAADNSVTASAHTIQVRLILPYLQV